MRALHRECASAASVVRLFFHAISVCVYLDEAGHAFQRVCRACVLMTSLAELVRPGPCSIAIWR